MPTLEERKALAEEDPAYGRVICRCETVTEGEIRDAVLSGAETLEGIKLRCGAGMGKCQGARCRHKSERILETWKSRKEKGAQKETRIMPETAGETVVAGKDHAAVEADAAVYCDVLLIGAGAAGLSLAAELAKRRPSLKILLLDREEKPGGILNQCLHEGFPDPVTGRLIDGPAYRDRLLKDIPEGSVEFLSGAHITRIAEETGGEEQAAAVAAVTAEGAVNGSWMRFRARTAVLCCGAFERTAGMLEIPGTRPEGVYTAGEVQRMLNLEDRRPGRRAVLLGAGDMGLIVSELMFRKGMDVVRIVEPEDHVTASPGNIRKYLSGPEPLIPPDRIFCRSRAVKIHGTGKLSGVTVQTGKDEEAEYIPCDTLVIAAGLIPDRKLLDSPASLKGQKDLIPGCPEHPGHPGQKKRILLFGNCREIASQVSTIRHMAGRMAEEVLNVLADR